MKKPPLCSVVVPSYNQSKYLPITLDSIMFQNYSNIELIIVDDKSTDGSRKTIKQYLKRVKTDLCSFVSGYKKENVIKKQIRRYPQNRKIKVIYHKKNKGATSTYNTGLRAARGKYVTYIAGDDIAHPLMLTRMVNELNKRNVDFVYSDMWIVDDNGRILREFNLPEYSFKGTFCKWYFAGVSKLFKRSLITKYGAFDENIKSAMDYELFSRFAINGAKFYHIPEVLFSVRHHGKTRQIGQHSPSNMKRLFKESIMIANRNLRIVGRRSWTNKS